MVGGNMANQLLPQAMIERVARRFKVLSEPVRLHLLNLLQLHQEMSVQEIVEATGLRQANVSKHLNLMAREGILKRRKEGLNVFYSINDPSIQGLCLLVCSRIREETATEHELLNRSAES